MGGRVRSETSTKGKTDETQNEVMHDTTNKNTDRCDEALTPHVSDRFEKFGRASVYITSGNNQ